MHMKYSRSDNFYLKWPFLGFFSFLVVTPANFSFNKNDAKLRLKPKTTQ